LILLIRHGSAGSREHWEGDDRLRPLDPRGRRQAQALPALLVEFEIVRIVSSPYVRCIETVEPLAAARGLEVEPLEDLAEEHQHDRGAAFVRRLAGARVAVCSHGGLQDAVGENLRYQKGAAWVLSPELEPERYIPPAV
jgi:8-oxo-dGTP diphosphatase